MKKILITGANSYIGTSFANYMKKYDTYKIDTLDMIDDRWRNFDFSEYDAVFHVAGIAHSDPKADQKDLYYKVNTYLAEETAKFAKACGVGQFVFMSSIIVYGKTNGCIDKDTVPAPDNFYGDSKLQADKKIHKLQDENFNIASIRSPMIYGKASKGNYPRLASLACKTLLFPSLKNKRSMLHIDNLCEIVRLIIDNNEHGFFYPQNKEYVSTDDLVKQVAKVHNKKICFISLFNPVLKLLSKRITVFNKLFGDLYYDKEMSDYMDFSYCVNDFEKSIELTEAKYE